MLSSAAVRSAPLLYGRSRPIFGSSRVDYRLTRTQWQQFDPAYHGFLRTYTAALRGRIMTESVLSEQQGSVKMDLRTASYLLDFPDSEVLTEVEAGRLNYYGWPLQSSFEGIRLGNLPVADRYVQRETLLRGVGDPGAVVAASVGGVVVDRVYADQDGNYVLRVPVYYGSSKVQVDVSPIGGGPSISRLHTLYVSQDMPPPGKLYWQAHAGRETTGENEILGLAEVQYGLTPNLAARVAYLHSGTPMAGFITTWKGLSLDSEVALPLDAARIRLWASGSRLRLRAEAAVSENSVWSYYRRHFNGYLGWRFGRGTFFLQGTRATTFNDYTSTNLVGSATMRLSPTTSALLTAGAAKYQASEFAAAQPWHLRWSLSVNRSITRGIRAGVNGEGGVENDVDFLNGIVYGSWRGLLVGVGSNRNQELTLTMNLHFDLPWVSFSNHVSKAAGLPVSHNQSVYGSMELGAAPRATAQAQARTGAVLQAFLDSDRDGRRDSDESYLEDVDIHVGRVRTRPIYHERVHSGPEDVDLHVDTGAAPETGRVGVRADLLVPHQYYDVTVDARSLRNPRFVLKTGEQFSFVADPGQTKRIDIPVETNTIIDGAFEALPSYSAARLIVIFAQSDGEVARAEVSQEGYFSALLAPGIYQVRLQDLYSRVDFGGYMQQLEVIDQPEQQVRLATPR